MAERLRLEASWRAAHRVSAILVGVFALVHLCNPLAGLSSTKALTLWPWCGLSGLAVGLCLVLLLSGRWQPFLLPDIYRWTPP